MRRSIVMKARSLALSLLCVLFAAPALAAPQTRDTERSAGPTLVVLVSSPNDPHRAELEQYGALVASSLPRLSHAALASQHVSERFRTEHSAELKEVPITDIERYRDLVNELFKAYMLNQLHRVPKLAAAVDKLHSKVQHTIQNKVSVAVTTLDRCLLGVRMLFDKDSLTKAEELAAKCLVESGGVRPTRGNHSEPVLEIVDRARERLARRARADLVVTSSTVGCTAFVNDFSVGPTPLRLPLSEGHYSVRVGCGDNARSNGRVHRVHVGATGAALHVDTAFEQALRLGDAKPVVLEFSRKRDKLANYVKYARRVAESVGAAEVLIVEYEHAPHRLFIERRQLAERSLARYHEPDVLLDSFAVLDPNQGSSAASAQIADAMLSLIGGYDVLYGEEVRNGERLDERACGRRVRYFLEREDPVAANAIALRCWLVGEGQVDGASEPPHVVRVFQGITKRMQSEGCEADVSYWLRTGDRAAAHFAARGCIILGEPTADPDSPAPVRSVYRQALNAVRASCMDRVAYLANLHQLEQAQKVARQCVTEGQELHFWSMEIPWVVNLLRGAGWRRDAP